MEKRLRKAVAADYSEELKEDTAAALFLVSLKYLQFDPETTKALSVLKNKTLSRIGVNPVAENQPELQQINAFEAAEAEIPLAVPAAPIGEAMPAGNLAAFPQFEPPIPAWHPPEFPPVERLNGLIGRCSRPFEKQLTDTDVRDDQSRLSINKADVENYLMPLLNPEENLENGIPVTTYDSDGNEFQMMFKIWASKIHVLTGGWKAFFHQHKFLGLQDFVTVWMFRHVHTEKLCFAIISRRLPIHKPVKRKRN